MTKLIAVIVVVFSVTLVEAHAPKRTRNITASDYFSLSVVTDVSVSPNGRYMAYVDLRWEPETKNRNGDLWLVTRSSGKAKRLTFHKSYDGHPVWSPDNRFIYFTSARKQGNGKQAPYNGKTQVWRIDVQSGAIQAVTRFARGVLKFALSQNGRTLFYVTKKRFVSKEYGGLKSTYSKLQYGHGAHTFHQVHKLNLNTWRHELLIDKNRYIVGFSVAGNGERIAMVTRPNRHLITNEGWSTVDVYDAHTGKVTSLPDKQWRADAPSPYGWLEGPKWSKDGKALAFTIGFDGYPTELFVADYSGKKLAIRKLNRPNQVHPFGGSMRWRGNSHDLIFQADDHGRTHLYAVEKASAKKSGKGYAITSGDIMVSRYAISANGKTAIVAASSPKSFGDVYETSIRKDSPKLRRLTTTNPQTKRWKLPKLKIVKWKSTDGVEVEGILELPPGYDGKKPLPMITYIHGGPTSATRMRLRYWTYGRTYLASRGYAVFAPNYRGSTGYGDKFMVDLIGRKNDIDVKDILSGVDAMVARGIADNDRLGVIGWSNGGYLTNCVVTKTNRFKAASSGAGVFDVIMQWSIEDTPGHVINYQQGLPWTAFDTMKKASPLFDANKIKTPMIIHVGENDPRCPPQHSRALYRSLRHYVKTPVELVVYPGAGHSLSKYSHRKAHMAWDLAWFDKYLPVKKSPKK